MARPPKRVRASNGEVLAAKKVTKNDKIAKKEVPETRKRKLPTKKQEAPAKSVGTSKKAKDKPETFKCLPRHDRGSGHVLTLGQGDVGQLGLGESFMERHRPARVKAMTKKVVDVSAGGMHTVVTTEKGEVYTFGCNDEGALGRDTDKPVEGEDSPEFLPEKVEIPGRIVQISAGDSHTAALTDEGKVFVWGNFRDSNGAIGLTTEYQQQKRPIPILPLVKVAKIASGNDHLVLLSSEGHLYTCGCAEQGQLGRVAECFSNRGGRKGLGFLLNLDQVKVARSKKNGQVVFDDVWAGAYVTFAREKSNGDIYACGLNNFNQLGFEEPRNRFTLQLVPGFSNRKWQKIAAGIHHTLSLDSAGAVYALGRKEYGRLGLGEQCADAASPMKVPALNDVKCVDIGCGTAVSYAVADNGQLYAWGMGSNGQLGQGSDEDDLWVPTRMGGQELTDHKAIAVGSGGQHTVILVAENKDSSGNKAK